MKVLGQVPAVPVSADHDILLVWLIVSLLVVIVPIIVLLIGIWRDTRKGAQDAKQANDAVNHRHPDADNPRIYDAVLELLTWKKQWDALPDELDSAEDLVQEVARLDDRIDRLEHYHELPPATDNRDPDA